MQMVDGAEIVASWGAASGAPTELGDGAKNANREIGVPRNGGFQRNLMASNYKALSVGQLNV